MDKNSIELALSVLEAEKANLSPEQLSRLAELSKAGEDVREDVTETLGAEADKPVAIAEQDGAVTETVAEDPLAKFKTQYETLPKGNILAKDSTWEAVEARLTNPANAEKLAKVMNEMDEPRLYAVMEDGSLEFTDGNPDTPPMFVKDSKTGEMEIILKRNPKKMDAANAQINAESHQWASTKEMLDWAKTNGFEVFEADTKDERWFGKEMKLAEATSPTGKFVGKSEGPWMATALKDARCAGFRPGVGFVSVGGPLPGRRAGSLGLLRRLRV